MGAQNSYTITVENNRTEKEGLRFVLESDPRFILLNRESKKTLFTLLNIDKRYRNAFDLIMVDGHSAKETQFDISDTDKIILVELKTTKKRLPNNPAGFFFGATDNEFDLARLLGNHYVFCFVCLHPETKSYSLKTLSELEPLIRTNRIQRQINLKKD